MQMRSFPPTLRVLGVLAIGSIASTARTSGISFSGPVQTPEFQETQEKQAPISVRTNLVDLPISVTNRKGDFVDGLQQENFHVFENGREAKISIFGRQDLPVAVGIVVDHSASMGPKLREIAAAAEAFARSSNAQDHLFVVNFNEQVPIALPAAKPFTSDENELRSALAENSARGQTALYDAVMDGLSHLEKSSLKRQALILVTDGGDNVSTHTLKETLDAAMKSRAQIFCIGIYNGEDPDASPRVLRKLAKATGGEAYFPASPAEVSDITRKIAVNLRKQYTLGFEPVDRVEGWRKIKVIAAGNEKLTVHARAGYVFSSNQTTPGAGSSGEER
jgi:VWFA-related protein